MKKFRDVSLRTKLLVFIPSLILLAFIGLSIYNYTVSKKEITNRIMNRELPVYVNNIENVIQKRLTRKATIAAVAANNTFLHDWLQESRRNPRELIQYLQNLQDEYGGIISLTTADKLNYYSNDGFERKITRESDPWYFNFSESDKTSEFNVDQDIGSQEMMLWTNRKIIDADGQYLGIISTGSQFSDIRDFILSQKFGEKGNIMIVDNQGAIKVHEDSAKIDYNNELREGRTIQTIPHLRKIKEQLLAKTSTTFEYNKNGKRMLTITRYIPEFGWHLVVEVSKNEILNPLQKLLVSNILSGIIVTAIIIFVLAFIVQYILLKPFNKMLYAVERIAGGNLNIPIHVNSGDEIGKFAQSLIRMRDKLKEIVAAISNNATSIIDGSKEINSSSQQLAQGANEQASSVEEISSSMEQMVSNINQNSSNAQATEKISREASDNIKQVRQSVNETNEAMRAIVEKINVISEIADKTDLLAVNAAIEAARAGEHGKGFAVVATEVRQLSELTQKAAKEINERSKSSMSIADQSNQMLENLVPEVDRTASLIKEISAASAEQNSGAQNINQAIQQLGNVAQQNASYAEQLATGADEFATLSKSLKDTISFFKSGNHASNEDTAKIREKIKELTEYLQNLSDDEDGDDDDDASSENQVSNKSKNKPDKASNASQSKGGTINLDDGS